MHSIEQNHKQQHAACRVLERGRRCARTAGDACAMRAGGDGRDGECVGVLGVELRGLPTWDNRFGQYGIKVSFWGSGTLRIVIYVENNPQKPKQRLAYYHPLCGWEC